MNRLAAVRATYGLAALGMPDLLSGHIGDMRLTTGIRRGMWLLAARQLLEAGVCAVKPTRCVLALETAVDAIHGASMGGVAVLTRNENLRRATAVNAATAAAFVAADLVALSRNRVDASSPAASDAPLLRARDRLARRICTALPLPARLA